jgi:hypothetical protein
MGKRYILSAFAALALGFVVSCDNTTDDPPNNGVTPLPDPAISGPRILSKINSKVSATDTKDIEEYITNAGVLSQVFIRDAASSNTITATVTYSGGKISKIIYQDNASTHVYDNTYNLTYTSGKVTAFTMDQTILGIANHSDFEVIYDAGGQLYRIVEKKKMGGSTSYTHYVENKFTFSAGNVARMDQTSALMNGGNPDYSSASTMSYAYDNYDAKINPYNTLPKEYFLITSTLFPINSNSISANNVGKITIHSPAGPSVSVPKGYIYDSQNYPTSDAGQGMKYVYKAL